MQLRKNLPTKINADNPFLAPMKAVIAAALFCFGNFATSAGIELISKNFTGTSSASPGLTSTFFVGSDGRLIVFAVTSTNLVENDTNGLRDVFVYDRLLHSNVWNTTQSRWIGSQPLLSEGSTPYQLTPDNRYLLFTSSATGFVSGITFPPLIRHIGSGGSITYETIAAQVYVHDFWSNTTALASISSNGLVAANDDSYGARISDDGRFVAFKSRATNLVTVPDRNGSNTDIFLRDLVNQTTEVITLSPLANETLDSGAETSSGNARMSFDGRYFSFQTAATNVIAGRANTNNTPLVYWRDRVAGTNVLVSDTLNGVVPIFSSFSLLDMSSDGRIVCFATYLTNIVANVQDLNGNTDVFLRDMELGETWMVTRTANGVAAGGNTGQFSGSGRHLLFSCVTTALASGVADGNAFGNDIFLHDVLMRTNRIVTLSTNANVSASDSTGGGKISDDGRFVLFVSSATNLIAGTTTKSQRFYVRDMEAGRTLNVLRLTPSGPGPSFADHVEALSGNGRIFAFMSFTNLDSSILDTNDAQDLFAAPVYPPVLTNITPPGFIAGEGISGASYVMEASTNLINWIVVNTNVANAQGNFTTTDPQVQTRQRFYRLYWQ